MIARNRLMTTLFSLATAAVAVPAVACPPGGHYRQSYSYGYSQPSYTPTYRYTNYHQPTYQVVHQPASAVQPALSQAQATISQAQATVDQARAAASQATAANQLKATAAQAKAAFQARNYGSALALVDQIVKVAPKNNEALQFRSLIQFALGDYKKSAADAYDAMLNGGVWTKESLVGLYGDMEVHTRQLKMLKSAAADEPKALELHFLLAYQLVMTGELADSEKELVTVLEIKPAEPLATNLLKLVKDARAKVTTVAADTP